MSRVTQAVVRRERLLAVVIVVAAMVGVAARAGWFGRGNGHATAPPVAPAGPDFAGVLAARAAQLDPVSPWYLFLTPARVHAERGPSPMSISVTWSPPPDLHGLRIDSYLVQAYDVGGPTPQYETKRVATCPACSSVLFPQAAAGRAYAFAVWSHVASGYGRPTASNAYRTPDFPGPPGPVQLVAGATPGALSVTWAPATADGGTPLDGYIVQLYDVTAAPVYVGRQQTPCGTCTGLVFTSLSPGHRYQAAVYAHNAAGPGHPAASPVVVAAG